MDPWLKFFIVLAAVAIIGQMLILLGMFLQVKSLNERMTRIAGDLQGKLEPILTRLHLMVEEVGPQISSAAADAAEITRLARAQTEKIDRVFTEAVDRLRMQVLRADQILTGAIEEIEDAGTEFKKNVLRPVRQATAFVKGIKVGLDFLRAQRHSPERAREQQDEELFI
ncbi:MAG: hypothetical protein HY234_09530 [Acidobacteria bacterium]|nr:hypothetical protein [Acidobacteriota bacterium]MBI3663276.1 hypothetical protein [Acidobacteriota bacterium]